MLNKIAQRYVMRLSNNAYSFSNSPSMNEEALNHDQLAKQKFLENAVF